MTNHIASIALVTGANRSIGFEIARQLGQSGAHVLLSGRNADRIRAAAKILVAEGLNVTPLKLDVTDSASIAEAAR